MTAIAAVRRPATSYSMKHLNSFSIRIFTLCLCFLAACQTNSLDDRIASVRPTIERFYGDEGDIYMGGWANNGASIAATSLRDGKPHAIFINVVSRHASKIDMLLANAWVGDELGDMQLIESDFSGNPEIYIWDKGKNTVQNITQSDANEWHPSWSPDGRQLIFESDRHSATAGQMDIYSFDLQNFEILRLTYDLGNEQAAQMSPNGKQIAFHRQVGPLQHNIDIVVLSLDAGNEQILRHQTATRAIQTGILTATPLRTLRMSVATMTLTLSARELTNRTE